MHRIAYIVLAHKNAPQVSALISALCSTRATFFLHVDRKSGAGFVRDVLDGVRPDARVVPLPRSRCEWGGFGLVEAAMDGLRAAAATADRPGHVVLLSGQDYPIAPVPVIERFLQENAGTSFMEHHRLPYWPDSYERIHHWHWRRFGRHIHLPVRRALPSEQIVPHGGSMWWCMARDDVERTLAFLDANPRYVRHFRHVDIPDETFFHTILLSGHGRSRIVNDDLHFVRWPDETPGPEVLSRADIPEMLVSQKLFGRKFDIEVDPDILRLLDESVAAKTAARD